VNGLTSLAVTKLDVLDQLDKIPVCVAYRHRSGTFEEFPSRSEIAMECEPVYEEIPGWQAETTGARRWEDLPGKAQAYLKRLEELTGTPIRIVSVGPRRDDTIRIGGKM
jgi:adenylosuccinate synthase